MIWVAIKSKFSRERIGLANGVPPAVWVILGGIAIVGGVSGAWGDRRPIGGFFEAAIAAIFYAVVPLSILFAAISVAEAFDDVYNRRWLTWLAGLTCFLVVGGLLFWLIEHIPGVGWRWKEMLDSGDDY